MFTTASVRASSGSRLVRHLRQSPLRVALGLLACLPLSAAQAAVAVSWSSPLNNSVFAAGSTVSLFGSGNASGIVGGTGLDLSIVMDSSGSMTSFQGGKSRQAWQQEAAIALISALPQATTSVSVVEFDSNASLLQPLTPLSTGYGSVKSAILSVDASGGTTIGTGIRLATTELTGPNATAGRIQVEVVISDGATSGDPTLDAQDALAAGVEAVHTVGIPGHSVTTMQAIATAGNGTYTNGTDVSALIGLFSGTGGNLVGIDSIDVVLNDGSFIDNIAIDGLGNFSLPSVTLFAGANVFRATAYDTEGNSAVAELTLYGSVTPAVPEPGPMALILAGLGVCAMVARRRQGQPG